MKNNFQWKLDLEIKAPLKKVWEICDDLTLITSYHPDVTKVDLISGVDKREVGVSYRCNIESGLRRGWCTEKVLNYEKYKSMTIIIPEDSWGLNKILLEFSSELFVEEIDPLKTKLIVKTYYRPKGLKGLLFNTLFKSKMRKQAINTFLSLKRNIEKSND